MIQKNLTKYIRDQSHHNESLSTDIAICLYLIKSDKQLADFLTHITTNASLRFTVHSLG